MRLEGSYDGFFDDSCGDSGEGSRWRSPGFSMQDRRRRIVAIADTGFGGMGWNHAMPGIVKQQSCQQVVRFVAHDGAVGPLGNGFLEDRLKQRATHDRGLLARQDLVLVFD